MAKLVKGEIWIVFVLPFQKPDQFKPGRLPDAKRGPLNDRKIRRFVTTIPMASSTVEEKMENAS